MFPHQVKWSCKGTEPGHITSVCPHKRQVVLTPNTQLQGILSWQLTYIFPHWVLISVYLTISRPVKQFWTDGYQLFFPSALVRCPSWEQRTITLHGSMWRWKAGDCTEDSKSSLSFWIAEAPFSPLVLASSSSTWRRYFHNAVTGLRSQELSYHISPVVTAYRIWFLPVVKYQEEICLHQFWKGHL